MQGQGAAHGDCRDGEGSLYSVQPGAGAVGYLESREASRCRERVPSMGTVMAKHTCGFVDAKAFDEEAKERVPVTLY